MTLGKALQCLESANDLQEVGIGISLLIMLRELLYNKVANSTTAKRGG